MKPRKANPQSQKAIKIVVWGACHEKKREIKNGFFFAKIAKHYLCSEGRKRAFSCTLSVLAKRMLRPKTAKLPKTKNGFFVFDKGFLGWVKSGFYCVFEKLSSAESANFIVPHTAFTAEKVNVEKKEKL